MGLAAQFAIGGAGRNEPPPEAAKSVPFTGVAFCQAFPFASTVAPTVTMPTKLEGVGTLL